MRIITLGASNTWFPALLSALTLPREGDRLAQLVEQHWALLNKAQSAVFVTAFRAAGQLNAFIQYSDEQIWKAIQARNAGGAEEARDLKHPEYEVFTSPGSAPRSSDFRIREVEAPPAFRRWLKRVVLADRIREVRALIGFTRIESQSDLDDSAAAAERRAPISRMPPKWVPATEIRGEGLFLQFREENPEDDGGSMAGVLIYTAAPDSEGTLGGLVKLGEPQVLIRHIRCAMEPCCCARLTRCVQSMLRLRTG